MSSGPMHPETPDPVSPPTPPPIPPLSHSVPPLPSGVPPILPHPPSVGVAIGSVGAYLMVQIALQVAMAIFEIVIGRQGISSNPWCLTGSMVAGVAGAYGLLRLFGTTVSPWMRFGLPHPWRTVPAILLLTLGGWILSAEIGILTNRAMPMPKVFEEMFRALLNGRNPIGLFLAIVVAAPLFEEITCRGIVLPALRKPWGDGIAITGSAVVFGAMHMNPWQFFYATILGLTLGWLHVQSGSILPGILLHALNNGISWVLIIHPTLFPNGQALADDQLKELPALWLLAAAGLLPAGMLLLGRPTRSSFDKD
jgi:membrane protease YdiL (CAAX protease family)